MPSVVKAPKDWPALPTNRSFDERVAWPMPLALGVATRRVMMRQPTGADLARDARARSSDRDCGSCGRPCSADSRPVAPGPRRAAPRRAAPALIGTVVPRLEAAAWLGPRRIRIGQDRRQIDAVDPAYLPQQVDPADGLVDRSASRGWPAVSRTSSARWMKKVDDVFGRAVELRPQLGSLGGDARRARVQVALARHVAADGDQAGGAEAVLLGAEQGGDDDVARAAQATVGSEPDARRAGRCGRAPVASRQRPAPRDCRRA